MKNCNLVDTMTLIEPRHSGDWPSVSRIFHRLNDLENCLYLQLYYWGRDVMHPQGNQLVAYGFERIAKKTSKGTSRYRLRLDDGIIELHGWCMGWYREQHPGFVFVRRRHRVFLWDSSEPACPQKLRDERLRAPESQDDWQELSRLMQFFVRWLLHYEQWVKRVHGDAYRISLFREYQKLPKARRWISPTAQHAWLNLFANDLKKTPRARRFSRQMESRNGSALHFETSTVNFPFTRSALMPA